MRNGVDLPLPVNGGLPHPVRSLAALRAGSHGVVYHDGPLQGEPAWRFRLTGHCQTGELYVEVTDGTAVHVRTFMSGVPDLSAAERRAGIAWPDLSEAFALARELQRAVVCAQRQS